MRIGTRTKEQVRGTALFYHGMRLGGLSEMDLRLLQPDRLCAVIRRNVMHNLNTNLDQVMEAAPGSQR